jgi:heat shock protein HslJ
MTALKYTAWELESLAGNHVLPDTTITLGFLGDQMLGLAGCNHFEGSYKASREKLSAGDLSATVKWCQKPEGVMEQEQAYLAALSTVVTYQIDGDTLNLRDEADTLVLAFVAPGSRGLSEKEMFARATPELLPDCTLSPDLPLISVGQIDLDPLSPGESDI